MDKNAFSEAFKAKGIERSKDVETFLANMTGDQEGWVLLYINYIIIPLSLLLLLLLFLLLLYYQLLYMTGDQEGWVL